MRLPFPSLRRHQSTTSDKLPPPEWISPFLNLSSSTTTTKPALSPWVPRVLHLLLRHSHHPSSLPRHLSSFSSTFLLLLSPSFVSHVLSSPLLLPHPLPSLLFLRWSLSQPSFPSHLSLPCYAALISLFSRHPHPHRHLPTVRSLLSSLRSLPSPPILTPSSFSSLARSLATLALADDLLWLWRLAKSSGLRPSPFSYNCLLAGLANASLLHPAEVVFHHMLDTSPPDAVACNTMINAYSRAGRTANAVTLFRRMSAGEFAGVKPDKITYMTLIQANYTDHGFTECVRLYREMKELNLEVPEHAYTLVIAGLCRDGKPFEAMAVLEDAREQLNCKGNAAMYTALMDAFGKAANLEQVLRLFEMMKGDAIEPDTVAYGVIVSCLSKSGKIDEAVQWFDLCRKSGIAVNVNFYCSLIDGFGKAGKVDEAERLFEEMVEEKHTPDAHCYNAYMDALCRSGKVEEAMSVFKRIECEGCDHDVYTYSILIDGLFKKHKNEEALRLWYMMIDKGITPTPAAYRTLSTGLCLSGKVDRACKILDDMAPLGVIPETAYQDMINVLCKAGRISQACKLADDIIWKEREIPGKVRTIFINALRKAGNANLAIKMLHSKIGIGYDRIGSMKRRVKFQSLLSS